ncbi:MAG TPA: hypothetical protein VK446_01705 [Methylocystis sp.]|nr:hypothetical protein [Methylocystis sp.]
MNRSPPLFAFVVANFLGIGLVDHLYFDGLVGRIAYSYAKRQAEHVNADLGRFISRYFPS